MQRIISWFISLSFIIFGLGSSAQIRTDVPVKELDSLIRIIPQFKNEALVDHLNLVATSISQRYPDTCLYYAEQALNHARYHSYTFGEATALFNKGNGYYSKFDIKNSMSNYLLAMQIFENLPDGNPPEELGYLYMQIGAITRFSGSYTESINYFKKAVSVYQKLNLTNQMITVRMYMVTPCVKAKLYDSAFYHTRLCINESRKNKYTGLLTRNYYRYGMIYSYRDELRPEDERFEGPSAIPYFDTALVYANQFNYPAIKFDILIALGECYHLYTNPPDHEMAEKYYKMAQKTKYDDDIVLFDKGTWLYSRFGGLYTDMGKKSLARLYIDSALTAINRFYINLDSAVYWDMSGKYHIVENMLWFRSFTYWELHRLNKSIGNYDSAFYYLQLRANVLDSIKELQNRNQVEYLLAEAENEGFQNRILLLEKEKDLEQNKAERSRFIIIGLGLLLFIAILIGYILIRQRQIQSEQEKMRLQQKLFRTQMNPHFIFNSLASIQHLVVDEEPEKASIYLAKFSTLVRSVLYSSNKDSITMDDELKTIESYLALQKIRYSNKFEYTIDVDPQIDTESLTIPPMLAQPFIENAIEHGIRHKVGKGNIKVSFQLNGGAVHLEVEDDGVGREKSYELEKGMQMDHRSMATKITRERLRILNRKRRDKISFAITDMVDADGLPTGMKVSIVLPVEGV